VVSQILGINLVSLVLALICCSYSSLFFLKFVLILVVILANRLQFVVLSYIYLLSSILLASRKLIEP
jgi:hypothetical protein